MMCVFYLFIFLFVINNMGIKNVPIFEISVFSGRNVNLLLRDQNIQF